MHPPSRCVLSGPWSPLIGWHQSTAGPEVSCGFTCLILLLFWTSGWNVAEAWMHLMQVQTSLSWGLDAYGLFFSPFFVPSLKALTLVTSNMTREERSGAGPNHMTRDMLGEERSPWGEVLVFPVVAIARPLGLSALGTLCTWPTVLALLMSVQQPKHSMNHVFIYLTQLTLSF